MNDIFDFRQSVLNDPIAYDIWDSKYRHKRPDGSSDEASVEATRSRVVSAVYAKDDNFNEQADCLRLVQKGVLIPAGRVNAGAGTGRAVTEINCFVLPTVMDSMPGIQQTIAKAALTMQQGGGIGVDYSTIRPAEALVKRTGAIASGIIPFADQQDGMCKAIASAGFRRGAQMLTLRDDHPDLWNPEQYDTVQNLSGDVVLKRPSFISAKRQRGRLTQFNVSVLVSDAFLAAIERDDMWDLGFHVPRADGIHVDVYDKPFPADYVELNNDFQIEPNPNKHDIRKGTMLPWYVYRRVKARQIWEDIMQSTYKYAEPGVIYIDRINGRNNLYYCEEIRSTNPCAEQPLPPNGCCCLSSINTAFLVLEPFTKHARFDFDAFKNAAHVGMRMVDNVLETANFPLKEQKTESDLKRRVGLGITGWGDALVQLGIRYGSEESVKLSREASQSLQYSSYFSSSVLAQERGSFPLYDKDKFMQSYNVKRLPSHIRDYIGEYGMRNSVCNTIAPNGTISLYTGNVSSGHEPVYSFNKATRKVKQPDNSFKEYEVVDYAYRLYEHIHGETPREKLPDYFVGALDMSPQEHVYVHAAWQDYIDASVSKTINCPTSISYEDFKNVYTLAYDLGAKGCTTYRYDPDSGRGSVLSEADSEPKPALAVPARPLILTGVTYKIKWLTGDNWYVTVNSEEGRPCEVFINTRNVDHQEWVAAVSLMTTAILRRGGDIHFLIDELSNVYAATGGTWIDKEYVPSVVAAIGRILRKEYKRLGGNDDSPSLVPVMTGKQCPVCYEHTFIKDGGCWHCQSCGHNTCG